MVPLEDDLLAQHIREDEVTVRANGKALITAGESSGLVAWDFLRAELDWSDPCFPVEVGAGPSKR